jgi:hypothetical protein
MRHFSFGVAYHYPLLLLVVFWGSFCFAQFETATVSGQVLDPSGSAIVTATVNLIDIDRGTVSSTETNNSGLYRFPSVHPGRYRMEVHAAGFRVINFTDLTVNVQDHLEQNFRMAVGSTAESVTVEGGAPLVNTQDASVSTVVDRNFAENLPMNGRSFQTLLYLTPGVVATSSNLSELGQFSVNGQRPDSNYFAVDGVSANFGASPAVATVAQSAAGAAPAFTAQGLTSGLVSVDAMQEFRVDTSTFAPEFGRTPGAQVSILTRSGTNAFHGALFEYLRNDAFDANDWFANSIGEPRAEERQNDFGGVVGGPIIKKRTFFFFSYEGLRLRLPETGKTTVPSLAERQAAPSAIQPFLKAFPLPNGPDIGNGQATFQKSFSNQSTLNSYSLRLDHTVRGNLNVFARYACAPSQLTDRGDGTSLNDIGYTTGQTTSLTLGGLWSIRPSIVDDFRFNYAKSSSSSIFRLDSFGSAAVPSDSSVFISPFSSQTSEYFFGVFSGQQLQWALGKGANNSQKQFNIVDGISIQKGSHRVKLGVDYRQLSPTFGPRTYFPSTYFTDVPSVVAGQTLFTLIQASRSGRLSLTNISAFAQDTWNATPRLTLTYGLRWEFNPAPSGSLPLFAINSVADLASLNVASAGTPLWSTTYNNFAPRLGIAYHLFQNDGRQTVIRAGYGVFYDLSTQQLGDAVGALTPPFGATSFLGSTPFPLSSGTGQPPTIPSTPPFSSLVAFDPHFKLPYTLQWNTALEQELGVQQSITFSYIGAAGRRLVQQEFPLNPNANFGQAQLYENVGKSTYNALQAQFQRRMLRGLQLLTSYTWSHSIDTASSGTSGFQVPSGQSDLFVRSLGVNANRGASDFDIRHSFTAGVTYNIPAPETSLLRRALGNWSAQSIVLVRSAPPVDLFNSLAFLLDGEFTNVRPDYVPGMPLYLHGSQYPGGKAINPAALITPPFDPATGIATRQGDLGRNTARGFGASQWDLGIHREFPLREALRLQFRAEFFNLLNHPNFASSSGDLSSSFFGQSTQMLGRSLGQGGGAGLSPLYQIGGPRSIQFALKLFF